ncbi:MAG: hypothetical protein J5844_05300 [Clostridia bacterium]|nr:hypothetical protein [Clostridia bacterium]
MRKYTLIKILSYIPFLFLISLFVEGKDNPSVRFHCGQGMLVTLLQIIPMIIGWLPLVGWIICLVFGLAELIYMIIGIINVANDRDEELPFIGKYAFYK